MAMRCKVCGTNTIFYYWSTGRNFPRKILGELLGIHPNTLDVPVCYTCCKNLLHYP